MNRLQKNCKGFTLVEIIVTFALTAIFMSAAAMVLSSFMHSHAVANAVATEQDVAGIVMDTITGELSAARCVGTPFKSSDYAFAAGEEPPVSSLTEETDKDACQLLLVNSGSNSEVWFLDGDTGNLVKMYVKSAEDGKNYLALKYYLPKAIGAADDVLSETADWQLGASVYQNCSVTGFHVKHEQLHQKNPDGTSGPPMDNSCLTVTLVLENQMAGDGNHFTMTRTLDCYNLAPENIQKVG